MTTLALPLRPVASIAVPRSATHKLALALVWATVASGAFVFSEPAPFDVLTMGLVVLLPAIGLVAISPALTGLLALMLVAAAAAFLAATNAVEIGPAAIHTGVSLYLYVATFLFAAFVAKRPDAHTRLILDATTWAAVAAAAGGIAGYFDLVPGTHELMTRWGRATGFFKDPNVFGPFLVPAFIYALSRLAGEPVRKGLLPLCVLLIVGLAVLLSFSRGAWVNIGAAVAIYGVLHLTTARSNRVRLKFAALTLAAAAAISAVVLVALQVDEVANLFDERAALTQSYDEGPEGRFGGQEKAARLVVEHPLGIGAQQFAPHHHHEEPHNVYLAMFLNAGWLGGLIFLGLIGSTAVLGLRHALVRAATQPLFLVVYACFVANAVEGFIIDIDHWRHFYLLMAMVWGLMLATPVIPEVAQRRSGTQGNKAHSH
jgi:O-antigen ligase